MVVTRQKSELSHKGFQPHKALNLGKSVWIIANRLIHKLVRAWAASQAAQGNLFTASLGCFPPKPMQIQLMFRLWEAMFLSD